MGTQTDAGSIGHDHPGVDGQLRESVGLGPTIRAPVGPVNFLQGPKTGVFSGSEDVSRNARGWGALQILER